LLLKLIDNPRAFFSLPLIPCYTPWHGHDFSSPETA
jgi:hypothetical protein